MIINRLSRYPIKGLNGESLTSAQLDIGAGIVGDRRFAFGIDETVDDGIWRSSRSYLINAVNDNLLKFDLSTEGDGWRLQNPAGDTEILLPDDDDNLEFINSSISTFMSDVPNCGTPRLIDRKNAGDPSGYWDFPDSELLIVNLATLRELEERWNFDVDPKRFRYNILIDGIPAWSEFGLYGCRLSSGEAQVDVLRPARRCAATHVNPDTGERDLDITMRLVQDYGHGFLGIYAKVFKAGRIAIGHELKQAKGDAVSPEEAIFDIAPGIGHWPKAATICKVSGNSFQLQAIGAWPLIHETGIGNVKIHHGGGSPIVAKIQSTTESGLMVTIDPDEPNVPFVNGRIESREPVLISGPYAPRRKR